ncbi:MAG TPA: hypothetical protein VJ698_14275 [Noviherbaspirillum sp.]|uniref:hypothetical protein n=1 Tax=Noviherbaspirillum sp. TaxID=1926288 RepID=UPI002B466387|nr:hypothetical protein [Noviherbaspirillum sp.]HJV86633.1 hypothetical protein [Noviherbaspirillum sp.]
MNTRHPLIRTRVIQPLAAVLLGTILPAAHCHSGTLVADAHDITQSLPDLPGDQASPAYFNMGKKRAALGYATRFEKLNATLDQYFGVSPSVTLDYGLQLADRFGAGGFYTRESAQSELVVNGIFAPKRNLRYRLTGSQLRSFGGSGDSAGTISQNGYLVGARKYWDDQRYLSDLGVATYVVHANAPVDAMAGNPDAAEAGDLPASPPALGDLLGYRLDVGMQPNEHSRIEWRREIGRLTSFYPIGDQRDEAIASNRVKYSHRLGNCTQLQGAYSMTSGTDHMDLKLARDRWALRVSQAMEGVRDTTIRLSYAIPLGSSGRRGNNCSDGSIATPHFAPLVDAATARPPQLPNQPITTSAAP